MELKTKEDFVKAFIACGKKYGMVLYEDFPANKIHGLYNNIPDDIGDGKLYLVSNNKYEKGNSYVEHVTEEWNHSEEDYEPCKPYDKVHHISYKITDRYIFAFFVKPSFIGRDGEIHHIVTGVSGTQYNRRGDEICEPYNGTYYDVWPDYIGTNYTFHSDHVQIKSKQDSAYDSSGCLDSPISVDRSAYYQNGKLFTKYTDYGHEGEVELTDDWRAFTTYEEVLAFQKSEELRLKSKANEINSMHEHLQNSVKELLEHAEDVLKEIKEFKRKTKNEKNYQHCGIESFIKEYSNFDFFGRKWINNW